MTTLLIHHAPMWVALFPFLFSSTLFVFSLWLVVMVNVMKNRDPVQIQRFFYRWVFEILHDIFLSFMYRIRYHQSLLLKTLPSHLLVVSNHVLYMDPMVHYRVFSKLFPDYDIFFVVGDLATRLPIIGSFLSEYHLLAHRDLMDPTHLEKRLTEMRGRSSKTIVVLFPEGRLFHRQNLLQTHQYLVDNEKEYCFQHCLSPKHKGLERLLPFFEGILDVTMHYPFRSKNGDTMFENTSDFFYWRYHRFHWLESPIHIDILYCSPPPPPTKDISEWILQRWNQKEECLDKHETETIDCMSCCSTTTTTTMDISININIPTRSILLKRLVWTGSSQILLITIPVTSFVFSSPFMTFMLCILYFTSYMNHYHQSMRPFDRFIALTSWIYAFYSYHSFSGKFMLCIGGLIYLYYKFFLSRPEDRVLCHMGLHTFCYLSIFCELSSS